MGDMARRKAASQLRQFAVAAVQTAMKNGLEWAVKNPRPFLQEGGAVLDGSDLTMEQQQAVEQLLQELLDRLVSNSRPLWLGPGGRKPGKKNRATIEREAAEAGARRGW